MTTTPFNWRLDAPEVAKTEKKPDRSWLWWILAAWFVMTAALSLLSAYGSDSEKNILDGCDLAYDSWYPSTRTNDHTHRVDYDCENGRVVVILADPPSMRP